MSYNRRDVSFGMDGLFHDVWLVNATGEISVDGQSGLVFPRSYCCARLVGGNLGEVHLVLNDQESDDVWYALVKSNRIELLIPIANGIGAGGSDIWTNKNNKVEIYNTRKDQSGVDVFLTDGTYVRTIDAPYASKGINYIATDGRPIMSNDPSLTANIDGIQCWNCCEKYGFLVAEIDTPSDGIILIDTKNMNKKWFPFSEQIAPRLDVGLNPIVGISGQDSPRYNEISWQAYGTPVPIPPPVENEIHLTYKPGMKIVID